MSDDRPSKEMMPVVQAKVRHVVKNKGKWTNKELSSLTLRIFALVDRDGSEQISAEEVQYLMNLLGSNISLMEVAAMIAEFDIDQSGEVDLTEFMFVIASQRKCAYTKTDIMRAFDMFGKGKGSRAGVIPVELLTKALEDYGTSVASKPEIAKLIASLPLTANGEFDYQKHVKTFMSQ